MKSKNTNGITFPSETVFRLTIAGQSIYLITAVFGASSYSSTIL